ncbi:MAG: group 1 truncated hemoglobin [Myxococcota bacterium]
MTLFETIGAAKVQAIIDDFVEEMVTDSMIGFFFRGVDVPRLKRREYQFTAKFMGADEPYEGRPIGRLHRRHAIMGGQFDRRRQILKEHIERHQVGPEATDRWLAHVDQLRATITRDERGECTRPDLPLTAGTRFKILGG